MPTEPAAASPFTMVGQAADVCVDGVCAIPEDNNADAPAHASGSNSLDQVKKDGAQADM